MIGGFESCCCLFSTLGGQCAVHQDGQLQYASELFLPPFFQPCYTALPAGILPEENLHLEGGKGSAAVSAVRRTGSCRPGRPEEGPRRSEGLWKFHSVEHMLHLDQKIHQAHKRRPVLRPRVIVSSAGDPLFICVNTYDGTAKAVSSASSYCPPSFRCVMADVVYDTTLSSSGHRFGHIFHLPFQNFQNCPTTGNPCLTLSPPPCYHGAKEKKSTNGGTL